MKVPLFFTTILIVFSSSCSLSEKEIIRSKIELYEFNKEKHFKNLDARILNKYAPSREYELRKDGPPYQSYAIIQTKPKKTIYKDFISDSLSMHLVEALSVLNVDRLISEEEYSILEFRFNNNQYKLIHGNAPKEYLAKVNGLQSMGEWHYSKTKI